MIPQKVVILLLISISMSFGVSSVPNASSEIAKSRMHNVSMTHVAEPTEELFATGRKLGSLKGSIKLESLNKSRVVLSGNDTVLSDNKTFEMGLFKTNDETKWYLGIWFASILPPTYVWVANRERPIKNPSLATVEITEDGKLVLKEDARTTVWETTNLEKASDVKLLEQGNLVLVSKEGLLVWQSFDFPTDTWLAGMNLTATKWLTSWKSTNDPSPGRYSLRLQPHSYGEIVLFYNGTYPYWSTGNWSENAFVGIPEMTVPYIYKFNFIAPFTPMASFGYSEVALENGMPPPLTRFMMDFTGQIKQFTWIQQAQSWNMFWSQPENLCSTYGLCGNLGFCNSKSLNPCKCLPGFSPLDGDSWDAGDFSGGCRESSEVCGDNDGFEEVGMVGYDGARVVSITRTRSECEKECLGNCSCIGLYHNERTNLCKSLYGSLLNLRNLTSDVTIEDKLYVRVQGGGNTQKKQIQGRLLVIEMICGFVVILLVGIGTFLVFRRRSIRKKKKDEEDAFPIMNLKVFSYKELNAATKGFSEKLGHGGFGTVFLGELSDSSLVAVKRLERPGGGEKEFRAEVCTIGNIQHVNLVRLRGFCSENSHRLLVYEYMSKGPLSAYLRRDGQSLSWDVRFRIAVGTARGIAYLHEECRNCIIHCDIKPENILLDEDFSAKVSDFGLAKLLGRDFSRVLATMRGTWGYVAPEWISGLAITTKADVYSYGMTLLELIGGRRNVEAPPSARGEERVGTEEKWFFPPWAARQIVEGNIAAVMDERLCGTYNVTEAERVGLIAIWCIQDDESMRPSMGMVVKMLEGVVEVTTPSPPKLLQALVSGESFHGVGVDSGNGTSRDGGFSSGYNPQHSMYSRDSQALV